MPTQYNPPIVPRVVTYTSSIKGVNLTMNKDEVHIIPDKACDNMPPQHRAQGIDITHVMPMEDEMWDKTQKYIHKYNMRSSP